MAYGTPVRRDDIAGYYTDIRRGHPPSDEQLADLIRRYDAIARPGHDGLSPLAERTERQRRAIAGALGPEYVVVTGLRHAEPTIEQAVAELAGAGVDRVVGVVLAPHYSSMSIQVYLDRAAAAAAQHGVAFSGIESWATEPALVDFLATEVVERLAGMPPATTVAFTAHSLPERIRAAGDRYPAEVESTARAVAAAVGLAGDRWVVAWQSAGRTPEPWIGPDILAAIDVLAERGVEGVLVCPCGFVADHLEVLYDLDIEASRRAQRAGVRFERTASVNDDPAVMAALARRVEAA
jgi:ferrochelatase